jgi:CcmD family protein
MDTRNFTFMFYGFLAVWLILCLYVITLAARQRRIKQDLERLARLVEGKERS